MSKPKNFNSSPQAFPADRPADAALVSALVDDALPTEVLPAALAQVAADAQLAQAWERYYLLREALRGGLPAGPFPDLSEKVMTAIAALPESDKNQEKPVISEKIRKKAKKSPKITAKVRASSDNFPLWWPTLPLAATFAVLVLLWPVFTAMPKRSATPILATFPPSLPVEVPPALAARPLTTADLGEVAETLAADWPILLREHAAYQEVLPTMLPYTQMPLLRTASAP